MGIDIATFELHAKSVMYLVALVIDLIALIIIAYAALWAFVVYIRGLLPGKPDFMQGIERIRVNLGHHLILGLEFLIGADILRTAIAPAWTIIGQLAAIIGLRTVLDLYLGFELSAIRRQRQRKESAGE